MPPLLPPSAAGSSDKAAGEAIDALCPGEASSEEDISGERGGAEAVPLTWPWPVPLAWLWPGHLLPLQFCSGVEATAPGWPIMRLQSPAWILGCPWLAGRLSRLHGTDCTALLCTLAFSPCLQTRRS